MSDTHVYAVPELEDLLPQLWDSASFAWSDRAKGDRATGMADLRRAWKRASIPMVERQALFLRWCAGMTHIEIAEHMGTKHADIARRERAAIDRLLAQLNGQTHTEKAEAAHS